MTDEQIAVFTTKKFCVLIIRQAWLHGNIHKAITIKFLNSVGKRYPAEIVFINFYTAKRALQQAFIYAIAKSIVPAYCLGKPALAAQNSCD